MDVESKMSGSDRGNLKTFGVGDSMGKNGEMLQMEKKNGERQSGFSYLVASYFLVAQMAGAGFLALPRGIADAGWTGIFLTIFFGMCVGFTAARLGTCWVILEERWEQYRKPMRQPYMDIAEKSLGIYGRRVALLSVLITQIGSTIVYIILMADMINNLVPFMSHCKWTLIFSAILLPFVWLDSPKDFWQASVLAVLAPTVTVVVIIVKLLVNRDIYLAENPTYPHPTISSFSLGIGAILFSYDGASCFPTIQNDMKCRSDFWKSSLIAFAAILTLYVPVGSISYILLGDSVQSNILLSVGPSTTVIIAIAMQIINLLGTYVIAISPAVLSLEDIIGIPRRFGWQRVSMRSLIMVLELLIAFAFPNFGLILNLIGGSTMSILSFIFPPLMYIKLVDNKSDANWPESGKNAVVSIPADSLPTKEGREGMNIYVTMFFLVALMTGAGFLALPQSIAKAGWIGLVLLVIFGGSIAFSGTRLGYCWNILEERWPEYKEPVRQPYMEIAYKAYKKPGRIITMIGALTTMIGSSIVFIILIAQFLESLIPQVSFCSLILITGVVLIPMTWPGTPNDFWQASVFAVFATFLACTVTIVQLLVENDSLPEPTYESPTFISFSLSFSTILFAFGGGSVFPTIQNDMRDRSQFWKSVIIAFSFLIIMYLTVSATSYFILGTNAPSNILLFEEKMSIPVMAAVVFEVINLFVTYLIACNPVCQTFEEIFNVPRSFGWKRCVLRTTIVLIEVLVALSFPDFDLIVNLVGGTSITMCSFMFPALFYMKLVKDSSTNKAWPQRSIPLWEKAFLWEIVCVGVVGLISSTGSAILEIVNNPFGSSCFSQIFSS